MASESTQAAGEVGRVAGASRRGGLGFGEGVREGDLEAMTRGGEAVRPGQGGHTRTSNVAGAFLSQIRRPPSVGKIKGLQPLNQGTNSYSVLHFIFIFTTVL